MNVTKTKNSQPQTHNQKTMKAITQTGKKITIDDAAEIHRGGEGRILLIPELPNQVAKIYHDPTKTLTTKRLEALKVLDGRYFVKPLELIVEQYNIVMKRPIGFTMDYLGTAFFPLAALFSAPFCRRNGVTMQRKLKVATQLLNAMQQAHSQNVIIGDLSGLNVLVNDKDEVKLIDVDAYGTKEYPHSEILLNDIRDYYFGGKVSKNSDYFAYAVVIFQLLTSVHPYKGVHKLYKSLEERMIRQIPIFTKDNDLILPKCYQPIQNPHLQQQFEAIFMKGHRAPIDLKQQPTAIIPLTVQPVKKVKKKVGKLLIQSIYQLDNQEFITDAYALKQQLLLTTNQQYLIFDTNNKGYVQVRQRFARSDFEAMYIGEKSILGRKNGDLLVYESDKKAFRKLSNVKFTTNSRLVQFGNILTVIEEDYLKNIYLDEVNLDFIRVEQMPIFGKGVHTQQNGLWQHTGGQQYIWYRSGKNLSTVRLPVQVYSLQSSDNHGIITYKEQTTGKTEVSLKHAFFSIQQLKLTLHQQQTITKPKHIAYKALNAQNGLIFEPADDTLIIRRTQDFAILQESPCPILSADSQLFNCNAGILAIDGKGAYLMNNG